MKKKAVIVSGYFNPIHKGHLEYFNNAKVIADELFALNIFLDIIICISNGNFFISFYKMAFIMK